MALFLGVGLISIGITAITAYYPPRSLIKWFSSIHPKVTFNVNTKQRKIALSIDDSPTDNTLKIAQLLKEYDCKATWFIIGDYTTKKQDRNIYINYN